MIPDRDEIEQERTARELFEWVVEAHARLGETAQGRSMIRERRGLLKRFYEEVWPLANYAWYFFRDTDLRFRPVAGSQTDDGFVRDASTGESKPIQVTQAQLRREGAQDALRREHLERFGRAPADDGFVRDPSGAVAERGGGATPADALLDARLQALKQAVDRKARMASSPNTILVVEVSGMLLGGEDRAAIDTFARAELCPIARGGFSELAIVDDLGRFGFRYRLAG